MISIKISENEQEIKHQGNPVKIAIEMGMATMSIYNALKLAGEDAADTFKGCMQSVMKDGSPTWQTMNQTTIIMPIEKGGA